MIVVGVDGSDESKHALGWALEEARLRQCPLRVVYAFLSPLALGWGVLPTFMPQALLDPGLLEHKAKELVDALVDEVAGPEPGVAVERVATEAAPAEALLEAARDAELLVVGSRGLGGFTGLLLGSVGQQCAHHARSPVVIVRRVPS